MTRSGQYAGFTARKEQLEYVRSTGGLRFNRNPSTFNGLQNHILSALRDRYHELPESVRRHYVRTFNCFHGCSEAVCGGGLVNLSGLEDPGFFGAGVYATLNLEYAARYAAGEFSTDPARRVPPGVEFPVVMLAACVGSAYPITPAVDYTHTNTRNRDKCNYFGETLERGYDCHVACVSADANWEAVNYAESQYVEVVFVQETQVLPVAVFWLSRV